MKKLETRLADAFLIEPEPLQDVRGMFARTFCAREFAAAGLESVVAQCSVSFNHHRGTLRGLHYQRPPAAEAKLVRCTAGAIYDVIVDLRPDSPTFRQHVGIELTAANRLALYVPKMFAHGFQTLADATEVYYQISEFYSPDHATGLRHDDPQLGIHWPLAVTMINDRDTQWPLL